MIYLLLALSLTANVILIWYARKLLQKYAYDIDVRRAFSRMIADYVESLQAIYKLEEFYGEETLKKAIAQTRAIEEACEEFTTYLQTESQESFEEGGEEGKDDEEETNSKKESVIRLREGESVSQDAASYKKVVREDAF